MEIPPPFQQIAADPKFVDQIVNQIKSQGTFDQWRRECLADVDTKPAYQNLTFRVDSAVAAFLGKQRWRPDMVKNQVRENLRKHILELGLIDKGVDRIVQQVVQPKVLHIFHPEVENAIYNFLGIENPRARNGTPAAATSTTGSPKKAFRPMPVSIPSWDKEDCTPPPGEEFDLEAITPSSESRCGSSLKKDLADEMSDVSMEDSRPAPESGLERICSPISPQSSSVSERAEGNEAAVRNRVGSALSAISSGDDLPSASPAAASPVTSDEFHDNNNPAPEEQPQQESPASSDDENDDDEDDDDEDDFSSPEFEKLEINAPSSRTVTPVPGEEDASQDKQEYVPVVDDHYKWRPKIEGRDPDRKPDEDPSNLGSRKVGESTDQHSRNQPAESGSQPTGEVAISESTGKSTTVTGSTKTAESTEAEKNPKDRLTERSVSSSSKDRNRSKSESHKSDRRDKSRKDKDRDKDRDRQKDKDRDREREKKREREKWEESERRSKSHHSKSSHKDRDEKKKSSHRDKDRDRQKEKERDRDRNRSKSSHEGDRNRSSSRRDKERKSSGQAAEKSRKEASISPPPPELHPKAYLWKRPEEKPRALSDYLARFPEYVFDETYDGIAGLSDVSASSVSSYDESDAESTILLYLSEVEVDSEVEEAVVSSGGRVVYRSDTVEEAKEQEYEALESDYTPASDEFARSESCLRDQQLNINNNNKRVRKLNTRYSDSYVGSELRKMITTSTEHPQRSPRMNHNIKSHQPRENQENCIDESSPEEIQEREEVTEYAPPDAKRLKADQPLPSSPESVQSDLTHLPHAQPSTPTPVDVQSAAEEDVVSKETISPNGRRRSAA
nr:EOG090X0B7I [Ceriodaphnia reticulata]